LGRVRWPFRWLPAFHVLLALAAAQVVRTTAPPPESLGWRAFFGSARFRRHALVALAGAALVVLVLCTTWIDGAVLVGAAAALLGLAVWLLAPRFGFSESTAFCAGVALNLVAAPLVASERTATPHWHWERCAATVASLRPDERYLGVYYVADI